MPSIADELGEIEAFRRYVAELAETDRSPGAQDAVYRRIYGDVLFDAEKVAACPDEPSR